MYIKFDTDNNGNFDIKGNIYQVSVKEIIDLQIWLLTMAKKKDLRFER